MGCYAAVGFVWTYYTLSAILLITISANVFYFYFVDKDTVAAEAYDNQYDDNQTNWPVHYPPLAAHYRSSDTTIVHSISAPILAAPKLPVPTRTRYAAYRMQVLVHLGYTLRFHVGTAAFGALILTIVTAFQARQGRLLGSELSGECRVVGERSI